MTWNSLQQFLRIVMQFIGGMLVAYGWADTAGVEAITGFIVSGGALAWWAYWWVNSGSA